METSAESAKSKSRRAVQAPWPLSHIPLWDNGVLYLITIAQSCCTRAIVAYELQDSERRPGCRTCPGMEAALHSPVITALGALETKLATNCMSLGVNTSHYTRLFLQCIRYVEIMFHEVLFKAQRKLKVSHALKNRERKEECPRVSPNKTKRFGHGGRT